MELSPGRKSHPRAWTRQDVAISLGVWCGALSVGVADTQETLGRTAWVVFRSRAVAPSCFSSGRAAPEPPG